MFKNGHMPDTQGNSKDGLAGELAQGTSHHGASGGAMGGLTHADLDRGFEQLDANGRSMKEQREGDELLPPPMQEGGFAGRPGGWER